MTAPRDPEVIVAELDSVAGELVEAEDTLARLRLRREELWVEGRALAAPVKTKALAAASAVSEALVIKALKRRRREASTEG